MGRETDEASAPSIGRVRSAEPRRRTPWPALGVHLLSLAVAAAALMYLERNQWFFYDEWDFLARRGLHLGEFGIFWGHNEHWSTIPILIFRALAHTVGLRSYAPYMALLVVLHVTLAHLLWRCMRRGGADPWVATALVAVFLVLGAGANNLDWAFQIGFVGSVTTGMLALLLADRDAPLGWRDAAAVILLVVALMSSGIGVTMAAVVGADAWLRRGWRAAVALTVIPAAVYLAWLATGARAVATSPPSRTELLKVPDYVWAGLTRTSEAVTGLAGAGAVLVLALVVLLVRDHGVARSRAAAAYAAALGAAIFYLITAIGRIHLGIEAAASTRYVYIACALMLPAAAIVLSRAIGRSAVGLGVLLAFVAGALVHNVDLLVADARAWSATKQASKATILAAARAIQSENVIADPETLSEPVWAPDLHLDVLRRMLRDGWLPSLPVPDSATRLLVALRLEVTMTSTPVLPLAPAPQVTPMAGTTVSRLAGDCVSVVSQGAASRVRLTLGAPGSVRVQPGADGRVSLLYAVGGRPDEQAGPGEFPVHAGQAVYLSLAAPDAAPTLSLPPGLTRLCGA
ncbi:MAG: hypothetical protein JWM18_4724 [Chloroflexi bacterium]|nr:hypothetical protein [Chloroflexota bacterium]